MVASVNEFRVRLESAIMPSAQIVSVQPVQSSEIVFEVVISIDGVETVVDVDAEVLNDPFEFHTWVLQTTGTFVELEIDDIDQTQQWHDLLSAVPWLEMRIEKPRRKAGPRRKSKKD